MDYTISQAAQKTGLSAFTLRYYDKEGMLPFIARTKSGIRKFSDSDLSWLALISCMKTIGLSVKEIRQYILWCRAGDRTLQKRYDFFVTQRRKTLEQIEGLKECLGKIDYKINYYRVALRAGTEAVHKHQMLDSARECIRKSPEPRGR